MTPATPRTRRGDRPSSGEHERHLAISSIAQQVSQVVAVVSALAATTVLARSLSLGEFGTYAVLVSLASYVVVIQTGLEPTATKALAEAVRDEDRARAFSTSAVLYVVGGIVSGTLIAGGGLALLGVLEIPTTLHDEARAGVLAVAAATAAGWPLKIFHVALRSSQQFVLSAVAEIVASASTGAALVALVWLGSPLWALAAVGAAPTLIMGLASLAIVFWQREPYRYRRRDVTRASLRDFLAPSFYLSMAGLSTVVIYSLDRTVLAAFRSAATVALYEGPVRAHELIRQINGTLAIPVLPAAARYLAEHDLERTRDLLIRGTRYSLAVVVPLTVVLMVLARPILDVWLGERYGGAWVAMTILVGYWLVNAQTAVAGGMLVAAGRARQIAVYSGIVAVLNLGLSLALTPLLGLNGVVLGTTIPYLVGFPVFLAMTLAAVPVSLRQLAIEAWLPAYSTAAVVGAALLTLRLTVDLATLPAVLAAGLVATLAYWAIYYAVWLRANERILVRNVAWALVRR